MFQALGYVSATKFVLISSPIKHFFTHSLQNKLSFEVRVMPVDAISDRLLSTYNLASVYLPLWIISCFSSLVRFSALRRCLKLRFALAEDWSPE